ncbi:unnamed protein product [Lasius platythorax]|uniref:Sp185/333 n=1 Tax=Lasius platythorax TaxID=488582 RepID=A0AAV2NF25_9HYME
MMIKIFLITLVCATLVFADSPVQDFQNEWQKPMNGLLNADHFMGRHSSLARRRPPTSQGGSGGSGGEGGAGGAGEPGEPGEPGGAGGAGGAGGEGGEGGGGGREGGGGGRGGRRRGG